MKENQNSGYKIGMVVFVIISVLLAGYIIYNKTLDKGTTVSESKQNELLGKTYSDATNPSIKSLTITDVNIDTSRANTPYMFVVGTIELSVDDDLYEGVSLEGYCLDSNNKSYHIYGPQDGRALFHNGSAKLSLSEDENYLDGVKVDWKNTTIKYCKINKMSAYITTEPNENGLVSIDLVKEFKINYEKNF